jgi:hypothetical protein
MGTSTQLELTCLHLGLLGFEVRPASTTAEALWLAPAEEPDVVFSDVLKPEPPLSRAEPSAEVRLVHAQAVIRQMERQIRTSSHLARRCTLQATQMTLLSGAADALALTADADSAVVVAGARRRCADITRHRWLSSPAMFRDAVRLRRVRRRRIDERPSAAEQQLVAVGMSGAGMNRSCDGSCAWELVAPASGAFTASDEKGTESFLLTPLEQERLLSVVDDARFAEALRSDEPCPGVIDSSASLFAEWETTGTLVDPLAVGCLSDPSHPYFPVREALLDFHASHFTCTERVSDTTFRRALCLILPPSQQ